MDVSTDRGATRRVTTYLDDVARMLADVDPTERAEVLGGLREHLDAALGPDPSDAAVDAVLTELGDPADVAAEAMSAAGAPTSGRRRAGTEGGATDPTGGLPGGVARDSSTGHGGAGRQRPAMERGWVPVVVGLCFGVGLLLAVLVAAGLGSFGTFQVDGGPSQQDFAVATTFTAVLAGMAMALVPYVVGLALLLASPLWSGRERAVGAAIVPGACVLGGLVLLATGLLESGIVMAVGLLLVAGIAVWLLARVVSAGAGRAADGEVAGPGVR